MSLLNKIFGRSKVEEVEVNSDVIPIEIKSSSSYNNVSYGYSYPIINKKWDGEKTLGEGNFGEVKVFGDSEVAVKIAKQPFSENVSVVLEYSIMKELSSAKCCIAGAYELGINDGVVSLYMRRMLGDLSSIQNSPFVHQNVKKIMYQLCKGVYYAHSKGIYHRDIKMENILIDAEGNAYVADWGLACYAPFAMKNHNVVTLSYRAPEVWANLTYTCNIDVFSLGLILVEIIAGIPIV